MKFGFIMCLLTQMGFDRQFNLNQNFIIKLFSQVYNTLLEHLNLLFHLPCKSTDTNQSIILHQLIYPNQKSNYSKLNYFTVLRNHHQTTLILEILVSKSVFLNHLYT